MDTDTPPLSPPLQDSSARRDLEPRDEDIQKVLKWQEGRIARRLRGEYESAVMHLSEVINSNLKTPFLLSEVRVEGTKATRPGFLASLMQPMLSNFEEGPQELEKLLLAARKISHRFNETDVFKTVEVKIEEARNSLAPAGAVDLVFHTREKGRFFLNTSTELGNEEGSASATGRVRNVFGGAETFEANLSMGTKTRRSFRASLEAPLSSDLKTRGELSITGLERDNTTFASSFETLRGLKATVRTGASNAGYGLHEFSYEAVMRHIGAFAPTASISMRRSGGQTSKSALSHTWTLDTRDDRITGSQGCHLKVFQELAGLGGDAAFYKIDSEAQVSRPIWPGVTVSLGSRAGLLWGLYDKPTLFSDRFQLGGPTSVRMFRHNGLGPRDGPDSLGGDLFWSTGLSVISSVPRKPHWPVKIHGFVNAGRLDAIDQSQPLASEIRNSLRRPSVSVGLGLIYRFDPVRVEVNFGVPLVASKSDATRKGLQVGMGLEFL